MAIDWAKTLLSVLWSDAEQTFELGTVAPYWNTQEGKNRKPPYFTVFQAAEPTARPPAEPAPAVTPARPRPARREVPPAGERERRDEAPREDGGARPGERPAPQPGEEPYIERPRGEGEMPERNRTGRGGLPPHEHDMTHGHDEKYAPTGHGHEDKADVGHGHNGRYVTPDQMNEGLRGKADSAHAHPDIKDAQVEVARQLKEYVDDQTRAMKEEVERLGRKVSDEDEILYRGYTLRNATRDKTAAVNTEVASIGRFYDAAKALKDKVDLDLPKLDALQGQERDAPTGRFQDQAMADFDAVVPGLEGQYRMIVQNMHTAETTVGHLMDELTGMETVLQTEKTQFEKGRAAYERVATAYRSQVGRTEEDDLGKYLKAGRETKSDRAEELRTNYDRLVGLMSITLNDIGQYRTAAQGVKSVVVALKGEAAIKVDRITGYVGRTPTQGPSAPSA